MTDEEAHDLMVELLDLKVERPGAIWVKVIDLCHWGKAAIRRLPGPKPPFDRTAYMRHYMRRRRAIAKANKQIENRP